MKQKIVIWVCMNDQQSLCQSLMPTVCFSALNPQSKALKIAVCLPGVEQAALGGTEKDQIEVTGNGIDAVRLTDMLRKKVGFAYLISVTPVGEEKKKEKKEKPQVKPMVCSYGVPHCEIYEMRDPYPCFIL
ncbi:hypothetical protein HS088_TW22G00202 [Tripterygium wilfordii]|uniref:Uncharacterized protein n=1 Tax=Tripterygium wilfordii TaxID=458696 RepID=A0A7J7BXE1_TRIWF|nr:heavy metal-associated isoprenylated plant protein 16-like [Tripterygium wilfordii]KAF5726524.1 hypothetical protein HS088_TW22G00202 [Tripterygium wilfordii]